MLTAQLLNARHSDRDFWFAGVANDVVVGQLESRDRTISHARLILVEPEESRVEDRLREEVAKFKRLASQFAMHLKDEVRQRVIAQFSMLLAPDDWDEADLLPSDSSERTFLRALAFMKPSVRPSLGLAGPNLLAMWTNDSTSLTLEFQAADRVRWFVRRGQGNEVDTAAGTTSAMSLPNILEGFGVVGILNGAQ